MSEDQDYTRRARTRGVLLLVVVLVVGGLLGAAEERYRQQRETAPSVPTRPHRYDYPGALGRMDLTDAQHAAIDSMIDLERPHFETLVQRVLPDLRAEADSLRAVIRTVLTPEQQQLFDREPRPKGTELLRRFSSAAAPRDTTP